MRIHVVGTSGSGKTTTARAAARRLGVPHLELDSIRHQANWTEMPTDEMHAVVTAYAPFVTTDPRWVVLTSRRDVHAWLASLE